MVFPDVTADIQSRNTTLKKARLTKLAESQKSAALCKSELICLPATFCFLM